MGQVLAVFMLARQIQKCSQDLLYKARLGEDLQDEINWLAGLDFESFVAAFRNDEEKLAFWINLYNGLTVHYIHNKPELLSNRNSRQGHFHEKKVTIAGKQLSLSMIEHGILRKSKIWWSLGYLSNPLSSRTVKALQVSKLDPRIHFALNCGGNSCPPIRHYEPEKIGQQLELAAQAFVETECRFEQDDKVCVTSRLFQWYQGDFGGAVGVRAWIASYIPVPRGKWQLRYRNYDWSINWEELPTQSGNRGQEASSGT